MKGYRFNQRFYKTAYNIFLQLKESRTKLTLDIYDTCDTFVSNINGGDSMATINLRDVPDDLHRKAKVKAVLEGISLKALIIKALEEYLKKKKGR